jgi:hypothetical protein
LQICESPSHTEGEHVRLSALALSYKLQRTTS